jgi:serine/threonine protein kinase
MAHLPAHRVQPCNLARPRLSYVVADEPLMDAATLPPGLESHRRYVRARVVRQTLFGFLCQALDAETGRPVAIKVSRLANVTRGTALDGNSVHENPLREVQAMKQLQRVISRHPGRRYVVEFVDDWVDGQYHYLVTEFLGGGDLFDALNSRGKFGPAEARRIFAQIGLGVHFIHSAGIHHLDLSLENVLLDEAGVAKICDFGAAVEAHKAGGAHPPSGPARPGKVLYMSPEVASCKEFDGALQDAFALGVILYELLTMSQPFLEASTNDVRFKLIQQGKLSSVLENQGIQIDPLAVDLINGLLSADSSRRLTIEGALSHPWLVANHKSTGARGA